MFLTTLVLSRCASSCRGESGTPGGEIWGVAGDLSGHWGHGGGEHRGGQWGCHSPHWGGGTRSARRCPGHRGPRLGGHKAPGVQGPGSRTCPGPCSQLPISHSQFTQSLTWRHWETDPSLYSQLQVTAAQLREHPAGEGSSGGTRQTPAQVKPPHPGEPLPHLTTLKVLCS